MTLAPPADVVQVCFFHALEDTTPLPRALAWADLAQRLTTHRERPDKGGPGWSATVYADGATRGKQGVQAVTCLVLDIDHDEPAWGLLDGYRYAAHTTWRHHAGDEGCGRPDCPHWRLVLPLVTPVAVADWEEFRARARFWLAPNADEGAKDAPRFFWLPSCAPGAERDSRVAEGEPLDPALLRPVPADPPPPPAPAPASPPARHEARPGDDYARQTDWAAILEPLGWRCVHRGDDGLRWRRPGKAHGWSATSGRGEHDNLYVFTSSAPPFEPGQSYTKFRATSLLEYGGDDRAAAKALAARGFGTPRPAIGANVPPLSSMAPMAPMDDGPPPIDAIDAIGANKREVSSMAPMDDGPPPIDAIDAIGANKREVSSMAPMAVGTLSTHSQNGTNGVGANEKLATSTAVSVRLSTVVPEVVRWLWAGRLPLGKLALIDGDPGLGKSTMLLDIAARVTRGDAMPDGSRGDVVGAGGVVILQAEDGLADTIVPRLLAAGADLDRIEAFTFVAEPAETDHEGRERKAARDRLPHLADVTGLADVIARVDARLVLVDPLVAFLPPRVDSNKDSEVRQGLSGVVGLAERVGCCVVGVRHLNKASALAALYRGGGSIGIIGAARSGLLVASDPDNPHRRVLAPLKSNLSPLAPSLAWTLEATMGGVAHVVWEGVTELTAAKLLESGDREEHHARNEAEELLRAELAEGARPAEELLSTARRMGIAPRTLQRAADQMGVQKQRRGFGKGSEMRWSLAIHEAVAVNAAIRAGKAASPPEAPVTEPLRVNCPKCGDPLGLDGVCVLCDGVL